MTFASLTKLTLLVLLLLPIPVRGFDSSDPRAMHDFAHFSGGFMVGTGGYGIWKVIMRPEDRTTAMIFGVLTTALACATKEAADLGRPDGRGQFSGRDFGYCMGGGAAATLTIITFGF